MSTSTRGSVCPSRVANASMDCFERRSAASKSTWAEVSSASAFATAAPFSASRATSTTRAPRSANCRATSRPMPAVPPVTTHTFESRSFISVLS